MESKFQQNSIVTHHQDKTNMTDLQCNNPCKKIRVSNQDSNKVFAADGTLLSTNSCENLRIGNQGSSLDCAGGTCFNVYDSLLRKQQQSIETETFIDRNKERQIYEGIHTTLNSKYPSLDCRIKCFVCGELVEKQKLSGHLLFGELKCSQCLLEIKTCDQFQVVQSYQNSLYQKMISNHHNQISYPHNQYSCLQTPKSVPQTENFCQHKDFVWPIIPTPIDFLKENLSGESDNINIEVCCYIAKLDVLASAKPWKVVIQSYWQVRDNNSCFDCRKSKSNFTLKAMLSRPFKPNFPKQKSKTTKNLLEINKKSKNLLSKDIHKQNLTRTPLVESQKTEKYTLLKSILDQPVRYNLDISTNIHSSRKCNIQDNQVSSSQTHILLV